MQNPWPGKGAISLDEFARYISTSAKVLRGMIDRGQLSAFRVGRQWRIPRAEAFRVLGVVDPEGEAPAPVTPIERPSLSPRGQALLQSLRGC